MAGEIATGSQVRSMASAIAAGDMPASIKSKTSNLWRLSPDTRVRISAVAGAAVDTQFGTTDVFTIMPLNDMKERYLNYYGGPMEMPDSYVV
jgi:hypothetical protein